MEFEQLKTSKHGTKIITDIILKVFFYFCFETHQNDINFSPPETRFVNSWPLAEGYRHATKTLIDSIKS